MVYSTTLRVPGQFFSSDGMLGNPPIFVEKFRENMRKLRATPIAHDYKRNMFVHMPPCFSARRRGAPCAATSLFGTISDCRTYKRPVFQNQRKRKRNQYCNGAFGASLHTQRLSRDWASTSGCWFFVGFSKTNKNLWKKTKENCPFRDKVTGGGGSVVPLTALALTGNPNRPAFKLRPIRVRTGAANANNGHPTATAVAQRTYRQSVEQETLTRIMYFELINIYVRALIITCPLIISTCA